jgi:putative acetyltransferase
MMGDDVIELRAEAPGEAAAITALVTAAFASNGEARLVERLRAAGALTVSLVAVTAGEIAGHVALSPVEVDGRPGGRRWLGLAPLAVIPSRQRRGIGALLVAAAAESAAAVGAGTVFVLGSSRYYDRLGFEEARPLGWRCFYQVPSAAFRVRRLGDPTALPPPGTVRYHPAFDAL